MTRRGSIIIITLTFLLIGGGIFLAVRNNSNVQETGNNGNVDGGNTDTSTSTQPIQTSLVRIDLPLSNSFVSSPLTVTGEARGNWYFEASFPLKVLDANGNLIGQSYAQAQGEWMTTEFGPFSGTISFSTPTTPTGTLVLEKDNPSGLSQNADEVRVPIRFSQSSQQIRDIKLFFYDDEKDRGVDGNILCSSKGLVAVERIIPFTNTPIQDAVRELLKGPTPSERISQSLDTDFPLSGVTLIGASLNNNVLTLTFSDPQNKTSGGSCRVSILSAQIDATAKQFGSVSTVRIMPEELFQP